MESLAAVNQTKLVVRKSSAFMQLEADLPVMVQNLGESKLIIDVLLNPNSKKKLILDC